MNEPAIFFERRQRAAGRLPPARLPAWAAWRALGLARAGRRAWRDLQLVETGRYKTLSAANQFNFRLLPPPRGRILDRNGVVLASNRPNFRLLVIRDETKDLDGTLDCAGQADPASPSDRRAADRARSTTSPRFVPGGGRRRPDLGGVRRGSTCARRELPGVEADMDEARVYPFGGAFAHVIGYVAKVSDDRR